MSPPSPDAIWELLSEAAELPHGPARVGLQEEAIRLADEHGQENIAYQARMDLLESSVFGGYPEKALVSFSWCVAKGDEKPEQFPDSRIVAGYFYSLDILWAYKWVTMVARGFHQIPRPRLEATLEDMADRYRKHGYSLRPYWMEKTRVLWEFGEDLDQMRAAYDTFVGMPRDTYSDCPACERNFRVHVHLWQQEWDKALRTARPLLIGEEACAEVPQITYGAVLQALLELGELDRAEEYHRRGYSQINDNRDHVTSIADHVDYLIRVGDLEQALRIFERHLPWAIETLDPSRKLTYFRSGAPLFRALAESCEALSLRNVGALGLDDSDAYEPLQLATFFDTKAREIARAFDRRNGNSVAEQRLNAHAQRVVPGNYAASPPTSS